MRVLVACEESQAVTKEFRKLGHEAYSCDIQECSGGHPEWHIMMDVTKLINGSKMYGKDVYSVFKTVDGTIHELPYRWDMIIAFPPCTHLAVSGARHFEKKREDGRQRDGIEFFCKFLIADCDRISIENPVNIIAGDYVTKWFPELAEKYGLPKKPTQRIQPYEFGHPTKKTTCLWLKGLPKLEPTNIVEPKLETFECKDGRIATFGLGFGMSRKDNGKTISWNDPETAKLRSKTFTGIAKAMAEQWGIETKNF